MHARPALLALALALSPALANAQPEAETAQRPVPDYGRAPDPEEPASALLWVPRILFFPAHFVLEYLVRRPLGGLLRTVELERLDALFVGEGLAQLRADEARWSLSPIALYDHGRQPRVGLAFRVHDAPERLRLELGFSFWGKEQLHGDLRAEALLSGAEITLEASGGLLSDGIFHGLGWRSPDAPRVRYEEVRGVGTLSVSARPWRRSRLTSGARVGVHRFDDTRFAQGDDMSIDAAIAAGAIDPPPGYPDGYTAFDTFLRAVLDTREEGDWPHASGARAELFGAWSVDLERGVEASWARFFAELELALEVLRDRTIALRSVVALVEALGSDAIPFTEQVWLGGALHRMPGFLSGRLIGESAVTLGLSWRYAIWPWIDAALFIDVGNVFGPRFEDFDVERLRLSFGTALMAPDADDFTLLLAFGTEPFVGGTTVSSIRFAIAVGAR